MPVVINDDVIKSIALVMARAGEKYCLDNDIDASPVTILQALEVIETGLHSLVIDELKRVLPTLIIETNCDNPKCAAHSRVTSYKDRN